MKQLQTGSFYGQTNQITHLQGITITDTEYTLDKVDWHYHENAYFTFILAGNVIEGNRKEVYHCPAGSLLFHNWHDPHYNIKPEGFTRGFHIELQKHWFEGLEFKQDKLEGSFAVNIPDVKFLFYRIFKESKVNDDLTAIAVESLLLQALNKMQVNNTGSLRQVPAWANRLKELLGDDPARKYTLAELSEGVQLHPVHLSRDFSKYFNCTIGEYIRKLRVEKSFALLADEGLSLTDIAFTCGFADQSHFLRCFKQFGGSNPSAYRKLLLRPC
ncbi:AraC family transcriptional regulator [Mucilaginibacter gossypiicola]|uniref:AraC family transcriptional regulator n=1 Tax=Mucilaginibacter gossypiicola TaxID=551995 RepID=A0A1H8JKL1_9SPHI|nr:AraC family transcriptional regulator [Mucilaginibacter gossypiicola]SEN81313.1 AraC family transcriptional regulator [Mucilaginibacter gossypiicola]